MIFTTDDLCLSHLDNFFHFETIKHEFPNFEIIAFAIANYQNNEPLLESSVFKEWFEKHKDWVEIGVHSYDHDTVPDGDRPDEEVWIKRAVEGLRPFLPSEWIYRSPGWQTTNKTAPILEKLGCTFIAYESKIVNIKLKSIFETNVINSHLYDLPSIKRIYNILKQNEISQGSY